MLSLPKKIVILILKICCFYCWFDFINPLISTAIVINFESLRDREIIDDQFIDLGVDFNGFGSILSSSTGSLNSDSFPPFSGQKVAFDDPELSSVNLRMDAVGSTWSMVGGYVTGNRSVTLSAYDANGLSLSTIATSGANSVVSGADTGLSPNIFLSINVDNIAYAIFSHNGNSYTLDDFTFEPELASISASITEPNLLWGLIAIVTIQVITLSQRISKKENN